jgi:hypothetical protein
MAMVFYRAVGAAAPITGRPTELAFFLVLVVYMNLNGAVAAAAPMTAGFTVTTRAHLFPFYLMCMLSYDRWAGFARWPKWKGKRFRTFMGRAKAARVVLVP